MPHLQLRSADEVLTRDGVRTVASAPLRFVVDSGLRAVVTASVEGVDVSMLVHSNAGFLAMLTHRALRDINGSRVAKELEFGLGHDLRVSQAGRGRTQVGTLEVAGTTLVRPRVEVFDLPTTNWAGMLGTEWLATVGPVVDFGRERLFIPASEAERGSLWPAAGDTAAMSISLERVPDTGRFVATLALDPHGVSAGRFVISTVAETTLDIDYARRHGVAFGDPLGEERGPSGAVVPTYRASEPVTLFADGRPLGSLRPEIYDIYGYGHEARPPAGGAIAGYVGADLTRARRGAIDFGS